MDERKHEGASRPGSDGRRGTRELLPEDGIIDEEKREKGEEESAITEKGCLSVSYVVSVESDGAENGTYGTP